MQINEKELEKILMYLFNRYIKNDQLFLKEVTITVGKKIDIKGKLLYCNLDCLTDIQCDIKCNEDLLLIEPSGVVKYGFIQLDLHKLLQEFSSSYEFIIVKNNKVYIKNKFIKTIQYANNKIELSLK